VVCSVRHHHGRLRSARTRHHDRADPRRAGRCRSERAQWLTSRKVDDADAAKARQLREKGIAATDVARMLRVSRATVYRYFAHDAVDRGAVSLRRAADA